MILLDGKTCAESIRKDLAKQIKDLDLHPTLHIINVGDDYASQIYIRNKNNACEEVGIQCIIDHFDANAKEDEIAQRIATLNEDDSVDGIIVQLPLPGHLNADRLINLIAPQKDVDGLTYVNAGKLSHNDPTAIVGCTPLGIMRLLQFYNINVEGKRCTIVGRSNIVGKPLATLMTNANATVTLCHSKTPYLYKSAENADVLVVAVGKPNFAGAGLMNDGIIVIDVGINRDENNKLCGDVDFEEAKKYASYITPVPGGVGPMTVAMLLENVVHSAIERKR